MQTRAVLTQRGMSVTLDTYPSVVFKPLEQEKGENPKIPASRYLVNL